MKKFRAEHEGKVYLIWQALYCGKKAGRDYWTYMQKSIKLLYFTSCKVDSDVWMRKPSKKMKACTRSTFYCIPMTSWWIITKGRMYCDPKLENISSWRNHQFNRLIFILVARTKNIWLKEIKVLFMHGLSVHFNMYRFSE